MTLYLDYAATTPVYPQVIDLIQISLASQYGNPSSTHALGKAAKQALNQARERLGKQLGVAAQNLYFTSGATEANNWAIRSQAYLAKALGRGQHLVALAVEHPSVDKVLKALAAEGWEISWIHPQAGQADQVLVDQFLAASRPDTSGWICMAVNNEVGSIYPIPRLSSQARQRGYFFHVDLVQGLGKLDWSLEELATSWSLSGHKLGAPKGIGLLYYHPWQADMTLEPYLIGGDQEAGKRAGTENLAYSQALALAVELTLQAQVDQQRQLRALEETFLAQLAEAGIDYELNQPHDQQLPGFLNIWLKGLTASQVLIQLDLAGICVSAGSACSAGSLDPSRVLRTYYPDQASRQTESVRITFGGALTPDELEPVIHQLRRLKERKAMNYGIH